MKVLLLTDSDVLAGTERHMLDLARGLRGQGVDATLACPPGTPLARAGAEHGVAHLPLPRRRAIDVGVVRRLAGALRSGRAELIHAHNGRSALHAAAARAVAGRGRLITTQHFIAPSRSRRSGWRGRASSAVHRWLERRLDRTIAISQAVHDAALERSDTARSKLTIVPNGVRDPRDETRTPPADVRRGLGVPAGAALVVCAARLQPEKDVATLVSAMRRVVDALPSSRCVIAGRGAEQAALRRHIDALGLGGQVRLLGFRSDVPDLIAAGDLFVLPAKAEPFGLVLLEAMGLGRPVIATRAGGPLDIVVPGETGELVPPGDPASMADAVLGLLRSEERRRAMGGAGRRRFEARYTAERMSAAVAGVYRSVLKGAPHAGSVPSRALAGER